MLDRGVKFRLWAESGQYRFIRLCGAGSIISAVVAVLVAVYSVSLQSRDLRLAPHLHR